MHMANQPPAVPGAQGQNTGTAAPWSQPTQMPSASGRAGAPAVRAPVAGSKTQAQAVHSSTATQAESGSSTDAQIPMTKAPWAR